MVHTNSKNNSSRDEVPPLHGAGLNNGTNCCDEGSNEHASPSAPSIRAWTGDERTKNVAYRKCEEELMKFIL
jgi:hypothetical protein